MFDESLLAPETVRRIKRSEFDQLIVLGAFAGERIELIHGVIVAMSPQDPLHSYVVERLSQLLMRKLSRRVSVRVQLPFAAGSDSEPEPDIAVVPKADYSIDHPKRALLVVEVAVSSLSKDKLIKSALYAAAGIAEYWLVDAQKSLVEVYSDIDSSAYTRVTPYRAGQAIKSSTGVTLRVNDFLAKAKTRRSR